MKLFRQIFIEPIPSKLRRTLSKDGSKWVTDEVYNTLLSGLGLLLSSIGICFLLVQSLRAQKIGHFLAFSIYGLALMTMFASSTLHHAVDGSEKTERFFLQLDLFAIFLMIAGTTTPFCLILLRNKLGLIVLGCIWVLALGGIALKIFCPNVPRFIFTLLYLALGWFGVIILPTIFQKLHWEGLFGFLGGGVLYSVGAILYLLEKPNPFPQKFGFHEIWHLFVLGGAGCHFYLMAAYLLPSN